MNERVIVPGRMPIYLSILFISYVGHYSLSQ
eukprot:COSAG05_NODE_3702_length_1895_cov_3.036748_1_plen_30_part_10